MRIILTLAVLSSPALVASAVRDSPRPEWPAVTQEAKPWAYNWWMASAVDAEGLERQCAEMEEAGFGGFHVIPIYGAKGAEAKSREFLSPDWAEAWNLAVRTARRHGLGVDLSMGSGWCFGGPWVTREDAASSGMRVKRAGPGGAGFMIDPFSPAAMSNHVARFSALFGRDAHGVERPRAFCHDSYEYLGAVPRRGEWDASQLATFAVWTDWCRENGIRTRYEAHGSPANWLDLYALADIPETEMFAADCRDILVSKFASSAAHVAGRRLVASETCTWMCEHFHETLADMKVLVDRLFLSGVNHVLYHGLCYSPDGAVWPGWCFYAASQVNPRNPIWRDIGFLNAYVSRCQAMFQSCVPDEDTLIYFPHAECRARVRDADRRMTVHNAGTWFHATPLGATARRLASEGCAFDYVSDLQLQTRDLSRYARIVVPETAEPLPRKTAAAIAAFRPRPARLEPFPAAGLSFTRFRRGADTVYFIVNTNATAFAGSVKPTAHGAKWLMDPMTGDIRPTDDFIELEPYASSFLVVKKSVSPLATDSRTIEQSDDRTIIPGPWRLEPVCGGPGLPPVRIMERLTTWSRNADGSENPFSGTMRYSTVFDSDGPEKGTVVLDLGSVRESARVRVNGKEAGFALMSPYRVRFPVRLLKRGSNTLEVEVTGTAANRIRWNDRIGIDWKRFYDVNVVSYGYTGPLDATNWPLEDCGLLGPVSYRIDPN